MKIGDSNPVRQAGNVRRKPGASGAAGADFASLLTIEENAAESAAGVSGAGAIGAMDGLLALQQVSDEEAQRLRVVRQGNDMLESLEKLRQALLTGTLGAEVIRELDQRLARQRELTADPYLHALMDDIELRVAVEKAKIEAALHQLDLSKSQY